MFTTTYRVAFSDTDPGGIVFFANFFKIAHIAYEQFFENFNLDKNYFLDDEFVIPIVNSNADFHSPVKFGDILTCEVFVESIGNTSFALKYFLKIDDQIKAEVKTKHVIANKNSFTKSAIPNELRAKLTDHLI